MEGVWCGDVAGGFLMGVLVCNYLKTGVVKFYYDNLLIQLIVML